MRTPTGLWSRGMAIAATAIALLVLNTLLAHGNAWPTLWPALEWRLAPELAPLTMLVAAWVGLAGPLPRWLARALATLGTLWVVLHYIDVTVPAILGRRVNAYWDAPHLGAVIRMGGSEGAWLRVALTLAVAVLVLALLYLVVRACIGALGRAAAQRPARTLMLGFATLTVALWLAQSSTGRPPVSMFAPTVSAMLAEQYRLLDAALSRGASAERLGPGPRFAGTLDALDGADVLLVFGEAYGAVTLDRADIATKLAAPRERLATAIASSGRAVVSARVVSPTFGGASWLAHASLLSGLDMRDPTDYQLLLTTDRPTLVRHFAANGYRTVGWMPGLQKPWPEGAFYGFDRYGNADSIGYGGRPFGFWRIPDQASMALIHAQEFGLGFGAGGEGKPQAGQVRNEPLRPDSPSDARQPRLVVFPTVTTHAPFRALPPFRAEWSTLLGREAFTQAEVDAAEAVPTDWSAPLPAYLASMRYQFTWLADYLARHAPENLVLILIGDHQPIGSVTGPDQPWDVPVHVIARNAALLKRLEAAGFVPGLHPRGASLGPMHALTPIFIDAFDGSD